MKKNRHQMRGICTGFRDLDMLTNGLCAGNLILLAGRPSTKKIVFAMNIAEHVALSDELPVAVFLIEKDAGQVASSLLTKTRSVDQAELNLKASNDEKKNEDRLKDFVKHSGPNSLYLQEIPDLTVDRLRSDLYRLSQQYGQLRLIVLDSLQLLRDTTSLKEQSMASDMCSLANDLKLVAMECQCPMLVLCELPKDLEARTYKRPKMKDLRTWGNIDQIADLILCSYRDDIYNKNTLNPGITEITVVKNVNGLVGKIPLGFQNAPSQQFLALYSETDDY
ncbi:DnaB-like helicase C-terminal domain-containing protein [Limnohabitans sp. 2KL-3]|uniref:DnaB-like helicase C-terminal domain-containing protein n=1 Tax=Limnohabitans sp. 2KL-3 TaxID=1100700 RepID=UPI000AF89941|nr:DnaB-like helicase C-terminal domain-containing protein [Limnohabitans sp. 2KL-3]